MKKKTPKQKAKKRADDFFSLYIRLKDATWEGYVVCYTCGKVAHYKDNMQNGHFISRSSSTLRFDPKNCRVQCYGCNVARNGNYIEFTLRLIKEKGKAFVERLRLEGKELHQFTLQELLDIGDKYKVKVDKLKQKICD